jgi:predicted secreted Zn-dependent protease
MAKVVIKTQTGQYVGGGRTAELVDRITRAYVYEDGPEVDNQLSIVNTTYGWNWRKVDAEQEFDRQLDSAAP